MEDQIGTVLHRSNQKEPKQAKSNNEVISKNLDRIHISVATPLPSPPSRHSQVSLFPKIKNEKKNQIIYSPSILDHNFEVLRRLIQLFQRKYYLIFFFNPIWLPNHGTYQLFLNKPWTHMAWGTFV